MKVLQINTIYPNGSTGKIAEGIKKQCEKRGIDCKVACRFIEREKRNIETIPISSWLDCHMHNRIASITSLQGCFSSFRTRLFLKKIKKYDPDIVHLHNLHGSYINHRILFNYLRKSNKPVVWTLHDCWAFTGCCPYFVMCNCDKWKTGCGDCQVLKDDKKNIFDFSHMMWERKKKMFSNISGLTLVTPSEWLSKLVQQSFLSDCSQIIIKNGINLSVFHPTKSNFREKYGICEKKILLGVAFGWGKRKGLDIFVELAKRLDEQKYQIVLVGVDKSTEKYLPDNIVSIYRTNDQHELAEIYTAADLFVNPTREEMFGLVNIEALACGTPVLTFNTGGCPECIDENCGSSVEVDNIVDMEKEIIRICEEKPYSEEACIRKAECFDMNKCYEEYIELYERIIASENKTNRI